MSTVPEPSRQPAKEFLTPEEREILRRFLKDAAEFPTELGSWVSEEIAVHGEFQRSQVEGLAAIYPRIAVVAAGETGAPNQPNWGDLTTPGPVVSDLAPGNYLCLYGFYMAGDDGSGTMGSTALQANGTTIAASSLTVLRFNPLLTNPLFAQRAYLVEGLDRPSNTIKMVYQDFFAGDVGTFQARFLITWRVRV